MQVDTLGAVYARALLEAADETGVLEQVAEEVAFFKGLLAETPDVRIFIENPGQDRSRKTEALEKSLSDRVSSTFLQFLLVVVKKGRESHLVDMLEAFQKLHDEKVGLLRAEVLSAVPLSDDLESSLTDLMATKLGKKIVLEKRTAPEILGGLIVRFDGRVADGSLKTALDEIRSGMLSKKFGSELVHED